MTKPSLLPYFLPQYSARALSPSGRGLASSYPQAVDSSRKFAHGLGSALLAFSGANTIASDQPYSPGTYDPSSLEGALTSLMNSEFAGPAQIIAAALLFLTAGRSISKFAGLAIAAVLIFCYMNNIGAADMMGFAERFFQRIGAAIHAFQTVDVS